MLDNLLHLLLTPEGAFQLANRCWVILAFVWIAMAFTSKRAKRREAVLKRLQYSGLLVIGFWLVFGQQSRRIPWLHFRLLPRIPVIWWIGLLLTALGVALAILARLSLGSNWSGTVTLKEDHELIRKGLYRHIRHPIYSGILLAVLGSGMLHGEVGDLLGFLILLTSFFIKAKREESFLFEEFGSGFTEHQRHTGLFLPKVG